MDQQVSRPESEMIAICQRPVAPEVVLRARLNLMDWLGCITAARHAPVARAMAQTLPGAAPDLLRAGLASTRLCAQDAALALGTLGNVLEMDDLHRASILHAGDVICAAALAVALRRQASGATLLSAIARGYEAAIRIGTAAAAGGYTPFYNSGTCGVFGAAIACADLLALDADGMADALGQAGMQAAGIWQCRLEPTFSKQLATAHAARAGVFAAQLAAAGFPGARAILSGPMGFLASYYPEADRAALTAPQGWAILDISFKPYPACRHTHPAISAMVSLRGGMGLEAVRRIDVHTYRAAIDFCDQPRPETADAARFSVQHAVAVACLKGPPAISDFEARALQDGPTAALRGKVRLHVDDAIDAAFPGDYGARVGVTLQDGTLRQAICPAAWGDPENPMSDAEIIAKFRANAAHGGVALQAADRLVEVLMDLPHADDLTALQSALTHAFSPKAEFAPCR